MRTGERGLAAKRGQAAKSGQAARRGQTAARRGQAAARRGQAATLAVLTLITFITALYMRGLNSGIPYYYDRVGYAATLGGSFVATFTLASTVMRLVGGQIIDHVAHAKVLLASLALMVVGTVVPALVGGVVVALAARVLQGAAFAVATNTMTVAVMGSADKAHIGRRLGINGIGTSFGTMLGALIAELLVDTVGERGLYLFFAALTLVAIAAVALLRRRGGRALGDEGASVQGDEEASAQGASRASVPAPATAPATTTSSSVRADRTAPFGAAAHHAKARTTLHDLVAPYLERATAPFMLLSFARRIPNGFCAAFVLIFARFAGLGATTGAAFFIAAGATTLACRVLGGRIFDSDRSWLLLPLQAVQIAGFASLALAPGLATLVAAGIGYGISVGTTAPLTKALVAKATPSEHWGAANGELFFFADIGKALAAFVGGLLVDALGKALIPQLALGSAILSAAIVALALLIGRRVWRA